MRSKLLESSDQYEILESQIVLKRHDKTYKCQMNDGSGQMVFVTIYNKVEIKNSDDCESIMARIHQSISVLSNFNDSPNRRGTTKLIRWLPQLIGWREDDDSIEVITEYVSDDLNNMISKGEKYSEQDAVFLLKCLLMSLSEMHHVKNLFNVNECYLNLSLHPSSLLFVASQEENPRIIFSNAGDCHPEVSLQRKSAKQLESLININEYTAPETLKYNKINVQSNLWSVGCIFYEMLFGQKFLEYKSPNIPNQDMLCKDDLNELYQQMKYSSETLRSTLVCKDQAISNFSITCLLGLLSFQEKDRYDWEGVKKNIFSIDLSKSIEDYDLQSSNNSYVSANSMWMSRINSSHKLQGDFPISAIKHQDTSNVYMSLSEVNESLHLLKESFMQGVSKKQIFNYSPLLIDRVPSNPKRENRKSITSFQSDVGKSFSISDLSQSNISQLNLEEEINIGCHSNQMVDNQRVEDNQLLFGGNKENKDLFGNNKSLTNIIEENQMNKQKQCNLLNQFDQGFSNDYEASILKSGHYYYDNDDDDVYCNQNKKENVSMSFQNMQKLDKSNKSSLLTINYQQYPKELDYQMDSRFEQQEETRATYYPIENIQQQTGSFGINQRQPHNYNAIRHRTLSDHSIGGRTEIIDLNSGDDSDDQDDQENKEKQEESNIRKVVIHQSMNISNGCLSEVQGNQINRNKVDYPPNLQQFHHLKGGQEIDKSYYFEDQPIVGLDNSHITQEVPQYVMFDELVSRDELASSYMLNTKMRERAGIQIDDLQQIFANETKPETNRSFFFNNNNIFNENSSFTSAHGYAKECFYDTKNHMFVQRERKSSMVRSQTVQPNMVIGKDVILKEQYKPFERSDDLFVFQSFLDPIEFQIQAYMQTFLQKTEEIFRHYNNEECLNCVLVVVSLLRVRLHHLIFRQLKDIALHESSKQQMNSFNYQNDILSLQNNLQNSDMVKIQNDADLSLSVKHELKRRVTEDKNIRKLDEIIVRFMERSTLERSKDLIEPHIYSIYRTYVFAFYNYLAKKVFDSQNEIKPELKLPYDKLIQMSRLAYHILIISHYQKVFKLYFKELYMDKLKNSVPNLFQFIEDKIAYMNLNQLHAERNKLKDFLNLNQHVKKQSHHQIQIDSTPQKINSTLEDQHLLPNQKHRIYTNLQYGY